MKRGLVALGAGVLLGVLAYAPAAKVSAPFWKSAEEPPVRVMFGGDIMLDRNVARSAEAEGSDTLFAGIAKEFNDSDIRIANLEGTITASSSIALRNSSILRFTFNPVIAGDALQPLNLDAISSANNHGLDFGPSGYTATGEYLRTFGIKRFGHPLNLPGALSTKIVSQGKTFCFVGYHALFVSTTTPVVSEIAALRPDCWKVIVMAHWGEEYTHEANTSQQAEAHAFIDAGADLVVGAHPHVVQGHEVYKGRAIFYSLGNFMFDQNFSWATTHGMLLRADFGDTETHFTVLPITVADQKTAPAEGPDAQKVLDFAGVAEFSLP